MSSATRLTIMQRPRPSSIRGTGYSLWSDSYDEPGNPIVALEEEVVHDLIRSVLAGRALDAACGTGRHAAHLVQMGHQVVGVDLTPDMLVRARDRVPDAEFHDWGTCGTCRRTTPASISSCAASRSLTWPSSIPRSVSWRECSLRVAA